MQRIRSDTKAALFLLLLLCGGAATHAQGLKPPTQAFRVETIMGDPGPTFPGLNNLQASATSVTVGWYDRSWSIPESQKFVVYRRDANGVWQSVHEAPTKPAGTGTSYSWVDTDLSLSGQCYMIAAVNAAGRAGNTTEECTVRPDPSRFPQTVPQADQEWYGLSFTNDGTGDLRSQAKNRSLKWDSEKFGVDLVWDENPALWKIEAQGGPHVMEGQAVALRVWGGGWLAYGTETWGVDLVLSSTPVYQWYVLASTPGTPIEDTFALWNSAAKGYLITRHQTWGVDLDWDTPAGSTPTLQSASVWMTAQPPVQGFVPFLGYFGGGPGNTSVLTQVSESVEGAKLFFIKPGHQSSECGDLSAVITLAPGATMTVAQMQTIWGSATPSLSQRLPFLACAATQGSNVIVNVQYRNQ
jgi:hypothetical protein